ncbi:hypothetical protein Tco_0297235 [Tanacetum coccineum]
MGLWYLKDSGFELTAFSDANHAGCLDTRKSTSGGIQFLGDKLETDIQEQDKKKAKNKQSRARNGKDKVKPKPKSKVKPKPKSKVNQLKKIQLEGLKLPNLKMYY